MFKFNPEKQTGGQYARSVAGGVGTVFAAGAVGAGVGYTAAQQMGIDSGVPTALGATAGFGVALGANFALRNPGRALGVIGTPLYHVGGYLKENITPSGVMSTLEGVGNASLKVAQTAGPLVGAVGSAAVQSAGEFASIARGMLKKNPENTIGYSLNAFGKVAVGAGVVASSLKKAFDTHEKIHMGSNDGQVATATPGMKSSTMDYAGATGDLNFSMYANRRG